MTVMHATYRFCLVRCDISIEFENGELKSLIGDKNHPLSKGYLRIKGKASADITLSPKRVTYL